MKLNSAVLSPLSDNILVVEDNRILRVLISDILAELGAKSLAFENADDALMYLLEAHVNCPLIIVDEGLPGQIQGTEFIKMVKERWPATRSILTSGYALDAASVPISTIYLYKPWSIDQLVDAITATLQPGLPGRNTNQL